MFLWFHRRWEPYSTGLLNRFTKDRKNMIDKFNKLNIKAPIDIKEILKRMKTNEIEVITEFFNKYKIDI